MVHHSEENPPAGRLAPEGTFVIQLRSGSDVAHGAISGRVEHVVSGESEPFASLAEALEFMARHAPQVTPSKGGA